MRLIANMQSDRTSLVRFVFGDDVVSFKITGATTLEDIAQSWEDLSTRHGNAIAINLFLPEPEAYSDTRCALQDTNVH